jgi:lactoylglutathione lyase
MRTSWVELCVSDLDASVVWFGQVLDFHPVQHDEHYAELKRGETVILLGSDRGPYWESERPRIPAPGDRGRGVEIVLLLDGIEAVYRLARAAGADIVRPLDTWPWRMRQFWVRHPDGYLLRPAECLPD